MTSDGLPVELELIAPRGNDSSVLDIAKSVQPILPPMPELSFDDYKDKI